MKTLLLITLLVGIALADSVHFKSLRCGFNENDDCIEKSDWSLLGKSQKDDLHTIVIAVKKPKNAEDTCSSALKQVSEPNSPYYGKYYTLDSLKTLDLFSEKSSHKVEKWLNKNNFKFQKSYHGDWFKVTDTIERIENLLDAEFYNFHSTLANKVIKRTPAYKLNSKIAKHIDFIGNTISFPHVKMMIGSHAIDSQTAGTVEPETIVKFYGIDSTIVTNKGANQSLFEALGQNFSPSDLQQFQQTYNLKQNPVADVIGPNDPSQCETDPDNCGEANLDVQYIMAIAQESETTYWSIDESSQDPFLDWIVALGTDAYPPLVHSVSYGSIATENPEVDMFRYNTEACQLGLRGLTIIVASGDDGVANFEARNNESACGFNPSFPTTSPYVTGVGATQGPEDNKPEIACCSNTGGLITTGGGFSIYFNQPSYQSNAVNNYLQNGPNMPPSNMYNTQGRGYPDVSVIGHNFEVVIGGQSYAVSGTSASAPTFAAMVTLINNARLNANKPPVGFLNPAIYSLGAQPSNGVFNDITSGRNNCCAGQPSQQVCCPYGFTATTGWDPLTGFGSPNYKNFKKALVNL